MTNAMRKGLGAFTIIWVGQALSLLGTAMTTFALTIWAYQLTGKATALALVAFFNTVPLLVMSPFAGAIVDRSNRKLMMMLSDLASGLATIAILILHLTGNLQIWHLYVTSAISGTFQTFQWPAYSAAITLIVPKKHYARAHAMNELAGNSSGIFAPLLAGALLTVIGLRGILIIDILTFTFAVGTLIVVAIPQPRQTTEGREGQGNLLRESFYGFRYIFQRPSLLGLQLVFMAGNFFASIGFTVFAPMILARTSNNSLVFGSVETAGAIGGVAGGLLISAWGGPKRKVRGVLYGWALSGMLGFVLLGIGRDLPIWASAAFIGSMFIPLLNSSNQAIWQSKVAPDLQGRVFAIRRLIAWFVNPIAMLLAGPLADYVLEPSMRQASLLTNLFGWLVGTGPGAGMALMIVFSGLAIVLVGMGGYAFPIIRYAEDLLPDHQQEVQPVVDTEMEKELQELLEVRRRLIEDHHPQREQALKEISRKLREIGERRR